MATEVELAYEYCRRISKRRAKNFYYAFRTLPARKRRAIYAAYAFCRYCDDVADEDLPLGERTRLLSELRRSLAQCRSGRPDGPCSSPCTTPPAPSECPTSITRR